MCKLWVGSRQLARERRSAQAAQVDMGWRQRLAAGSATIQCTSSVDGATALIVHKVDKELNEWVRQTDIFTLYIQPFLIHISIIVIHVDPPHQVTHGSSNDTAAVNM